MTVKIHALPTIKTRSGLVISEGYVRIVKGRRGSYIEISPLQIRMDNLKIPTGQEWRLSKTWKNRIYYVEYRTIDECNVMIYFQIKTVKYADYKIGMYYVAPNDVITVVPVQKEIKINKRNAK